MAKPKYKEMYKEQQFKYKELLDWVSYLLNVLKEQNIINYKVEHSNKLFYDIIQIETLDEKRHYYITTELWDSELAEMLKSPSCPTETTEDVLNYYKSNRDKININVLEAIFNNTINSDKIIENAFKLYIYYYNSYRDNRYSKVILNHSRFTQEMYINLTKYLIKNKLGSFLHEFIKHKYCTKDLYVEAVCTNTFNSFQDTDYLRFDFTEEELESMTRANKDAINIAVRSKNCPKSILIKSIKDDKNRAAVENANMDTKTLDKIVSICDPTYYSILLCDKLSVKSILTIIKNAKDIRDYQIINILKQKDFEPDEVQELLNMDTDLSKKIILALPNINQSYLSNLFE